MTGEIPHAMEAGMSVQSRVSSTSTTRNNATRHQPLHTWGVVILTIAHKAYSKAEHFNGPIGILTQRLATLLGPIVYAMQHLGLSILSFIDHQILTAEKKAETLFPPSVYLFNMIGALVEITESVPEEFDRFDYVVDNVLQVAQQVPFFNWGVAKLIWILNLMIIILTDWGIHVATEKEIRIDSNSRGEAITCMERREEMHKEVQDMERKKEQPSYKEVLEKGRKKETEEEKKEEPSYKEVLEKGTKKEDGEVEMKSEIVMKDVNGRGPDDPILELFATAWHMN